MESMVIEQCRFQKKSGSKMLLSTLLLCHDDVLSEYWAVVQLISQRLLTLPHYSWNNCTQWSGHKRKKHKPLRRGINNYIKTLKGLKKIF